MIIALSTGSLAILADAIHSLTDLTNNIIATKDAHVIADKIESVIEKHFATSDITIHIEPDTAL